jgi:hypothetical protein
VVASGAKREAAAEAAASEECTAGTLTFSTRLRRFQSTGQVLSEAQCSAVNPNAGWVGNDNHCFTYEVGMEGQDAGTRGYAKCEAKCEHSIHTIHADHCLFDRESAIPYLETNRFRPWLLAIQRTRPIPYRTKVLGRALVAARTDVKRFWMLLSGNAEVAFPSKAR